jgi:hypothetical protein
VPAAFQGKKAAVEAGVAESLPEKLKGSLPTIEELESELGAASAKEPG